ncbi:MAG: DMT family transporter [Sulfuricurvum sp.]|jgi:transporter family-2 protein|uniref:DMT family transporter n=1 Tax=Sulfuricurvum sp. TaxID=2025608 RepID=UPI0025DB1450|nr:DMT family transporter [Sulfuricurvum sp.]MCK9373271.1 DMT family transporter [Sulfuricurvum sp.]
MKLFYLLIAFGAGIASSLQSLFNGHWEQKLDLKTILLVNASVVMVGAIAYYLFLAGREAGKIEWAQMSPSILVGGVCGIVVIAAMALAFPRIGPLSTVTLFIAGQMAAAIVIGHFGILAMAQPLDVTKMIGALLVASGAYLVLR